MFKQFKKRRVISLLSAVILMFSLFGGSVVFAGAATDTISSSGGSGQSDVVATITPSKFSATVPYLLPISVDADQNVYVADNAEIINNSNGPIKVSSAILTTNNGWSLVEDGTDFSSVPVNSKQFTMEMQGNSVATTGIIDKTVFSSINGNDSLPITYNADVAVQGDSLSSVNIANVVFTLKWDDFESSIPEGGTYTIKSTNTLLTVGQDFPDEPATDDTYEYGDYIYTFNKRGDNGWHVGLNLNVTNKNKTSYGEILSKIAEKPVTNMFYTFSDCYSLKVAPTIPSSVTNLYQTFGWCNSLTVAPTIPDGVTNMFYTFYKCTSLTNAPEIPNSVTNMGNTFNGCTSLKTAPEIPNSVTNMEGTFKSCESLMTAPIIPSSVKSLAETFKSCSSLEGLIEINVSTLEDTPLDCFYLSSVGKDITLTGSCSSSILRTLAKTSTTGYRKVYDINGNILKQ